MNTLKDTKERVTKNHRSLLIAIDVVAWISFLALIATSIWVFSGPAHFPKGHAPLSLLVACASLLPGTFGIIWTIIRSGRRYDDEKKRLQGREPALTHWFLAWMPFFVILIWMAIEVVLVRLNLGGL